MTFPGGAPGGYPGQSQQPQQSYPAYGQPAGPVRVLNLAVLLSLGVTLLGLVAYFCGFADEATGAEHAIELSLAAGLLAVFRVLPSSPKFLLPVVAVLSTVSALGLLDAVISIPSGAKTPGIIVVLLIMGILQMLVATAAALFELEVIKLPQPGAAVPYAQPGGYNPPSGAFPQQPTAQYGQQGQQFPQQPAPGQYGQPGTPPGGYPQQG